MALGRQSGEHSSIGSSAKGFIVVTRPSSWASCIALLAIAACAAREEFPAPKAPPPAPLPPRPPAVEVAMDVDGHAVPVRTALVYGGAGSARVLVLSSEERECKAFDGSSLPWNPDDPSTTVALTLAEVIGPAKDAGWSVVSSSYRGHDASGKQGTASLTALETDPNTWTRVALDFNIDGGYEGAPHVALKGEVIAKGCGRLPPPATAEALPQEQLTFEVGGAKIPMQGATVRRRAHEVVVAVTQAPHDCTTPGIYTAPLGEALSPAGDAGILLVWSERTKRLVEARWLGDRFTREMVETDFTSGTYDLAVKSEAPKGERVLVDVRGAPEVFGVVAKLEGRVVARRCK
jgi:hypothetical protein